MDLHGTGCRWQCLPAPPLPPKKRLVLAKKENESEPNDPGAVLELLRGEGEGRGAAQGLSVDSRSRECVARLFWR